MKKTSNRDREMMTRVIMLATRGVFTVSPNPMVGCVITNGDDIVGEGWHLKAGMDHAEIIALRQAGSRVRRACAYINLEPCVHHGMTGPCADELIKSGVTRVVVACEDPNPKMAGAGIKKLRGAGIEVAYGILEEQARDLNRGFIKRHERGMPWVTAKIAASIDGRTAMSSGESQWITSPQSRQDVQRVRAESCAIITGIGTQKMDDPLLNVRLNYNELGASQLPPDFALRQPLRVVVDSKCEMAISARVLKCSGTTMVATVDGALQRRRAEALRSFGAQVEFFDAKDECVDLQQLLVYLADIDCNRVLVEAGAVLGGAFMGQGLVDEVICYWAPKLFGSSARPMFDFSIETIDAHLALTLKDMRMIGEDIRVTFYTDREY